MTERTYIVEGMTCDHCVAAVSGEVGALSGVESVEVDLASGRMTVAGAEFDEASVVAAVDEAGYSARAATRPA